MEHVLPIRQAGSTMNYDDLILAYKELFPDLNQSRVWFIDICGD